MMGIGKKFARWMEQSINPLMIWAHGLALERGASTLLWANGYRLLRGKVGGDGREAVDGRGSCSIESTGWRGTPSTMERGFKIRRKNPIESTPT